MYYHNVVYHMLFCRFILFVRGTPEARSKSNVLKNILRCWRPTTGGAIQKHPRRYGAQDCATGIKRGDHILCGEGAYINEGKNLSTEILISPDRFR